MPRTRCTRWVPTAPARPSSMRGCWARLMCDHGVTPAALLPTTRACAGRSPAWSCATVAPGPSVCWIWSTSAAAGRFDNIDDVIPPDERDAFMADYKAAAGFAMETLNRAPPRSRPAHTWPPCRHHGRSMRSSQHVRARERSRVRPRRAGGARQTNTWWASQVPRRQDVFNSGAITQENFRYTPPFIPSRESTCCSGAR